MRAHLPLVLFLMMLVAVPVGADAVLPLPEALLRGGGPGPRRRDVVADGLEWLFLHQRANGSWGAADFGSWLRGIPIARDEALPGAGEADRDLEVTSLALTAYLGAGYTNRGKHRYARVVARGLRWLKKHQDASGQFVGPGDVRDARTHAAATLALTEAFRMTESPIFRTYAKRGLERVLALQAETGLWRYRAEDDRIATVLSAMAIRSMQLIDEDCEKRGKSPALGLDATPAFRKLGLRLDAEPHPTSGDAAAAALLLRVLMGADVREDPACRKAARWLADHPPRPDPEAAESDLATIWFGTLGMFQVGGSPWKSWNEGLRKAVGGEGVRVGTAADLRGTWHPRGAWCQGLGRVGATAVALLSQQIYYRYDKVFGTGGGAAFDAPTAGGFEPARGTWYDSTLPPHALRFRAADGDPLPVPAANVTAEIHGVRARVVLEFLLENPATRMREGKLELRLPDGAAPYYLAFGAWEAQTKATLAFGGPVHTDLSALRAGETGAMWAMREARMARTNRARTAYETIVRRRKDPALLTWSGGGVFDLGVFPLEPGGRHRVVLAYEVDLQPVGEDLELRLDVPSDVGKVEIALKAEGATPTVSPAARVREGIHLWSNPGAARIRVLVPDPGDAALVGRDAAGDEYYAAWLRPLCGGATESESPPRAVILVDTSAGVSSARLAMRRRLLHALLDANRPELAAFRLATFDGETHWWHESWVENTPENAAAAVTHVASRSPAGVTDLAHALAEASRLEGAFDVFLLSDGRPSWGARDRGEILSAHDASHRVFAYRTTIGGRAAPALEALTFHTQGALIPVAGPRDVPAAAHAHRYDVRAVRSLALEGVDDLFLAGDVRTLHRGQRVLLVGRGRPLPGADLALTLSDGVHRVSLPTAHASDMAPRAYGQAAVALLEDVVEGRPAVSWAYAAHFRVVRASAALLMLESQEDYERFGIEEPDTIEAVRSHPIVAVLPRRTRDAASSPPRGWERFERILGRQKLLLALPPALHRAVGTLDDAVLEVQPQGEGASVDLGVDGVAERLESDPADPDAVLAAAMVAWDGGRPDQAYLGLRAAWPLHAYARTNAWMLARLADALGRFDLALVWYEIALGRRGWDADCIGIVAEDYARFLNHALAGRKPLALAAFAKSRAKSLETIRPVGPVRRVVILTSADTRSDVELAISDGAGAMRFRSYRADTADNYFRVVGNPEGGMRMLVMMGDDPSRHALRVVGPSTRRGPVQVMVTVFDDWGRATERVRRHRFVVTDREDVREVPSR